MGVSDRRLHVQLTQEAKIAADFSWTVPQATDKGKKWPPVVE